MPASTPEKEPNTDILTDDTTLHVVEVDAPLELVPVLLSVKVAPENTDVADVATDKHLTGRKKLRSFKIISVTSCSVTRETTPADLTFESALTNEVAESVKKHVMVEDVLPANGTPGSHLRDNKNERPLWNRHEQPHHSGGNP